MSKWQKIANELKMIAKEMEDESEEDQELQKYRPLLRKVKGKEDFGKLYYLVENFKSRKKDPILSRAIDEAPTKEVDPEEFYKKIRVLFKTKKNLPAVKFLRKILDYGVSNGHMQLLRDLKNKRMKMVFGRGKE